MCHLPCGYQQTTVLDMRQALKGLKQESIRSNLTSHENYRFEVGQQTRADVYNTECVLLHGV